MSTNSKENQTDKEKPKLSGEQKQKLKKYGIYAVMGIICAGSLWFIFSPSAKEKAKTGEKAGFNTDIPLPKEAGLIGDKRDAYEKEQMKQKQSERMRSLQDFSALLGADSLKKDKVMLSPDESSTPKAGKNNPAKIRTQSPVEHSVAAYRDINKTIGNFYEQPKQDPEKEKLKTELEELKSRMNESDRGKKEEDSRLALMEKSFQMAAKYLPQGTAGTGGTMGTDVNTVDSVSSKPASKTAGMKNKTNTVSVGSVKENPVSILQSEMTATKFIKTYSEPRNLSFITATVESGELLKNTISASIYENKTITDGQSVRLRLNEPMRAGKVTIPQGMILSGLSKIQGERLFITVTSIEYTAAILPVSLTVYDLDGQQGIFIPNLQELNAVKEVVANMGTNAGTSITVGGSAGSQFAADLGRSAIQGVSGFFSKKLREVKVNLKAGYRVFLLSN